MSNQAAGPAQGSTFDPRTNLHHQLDQRTNEYVFFNGKRVRACNPAPANVPRVAPGGAGQVPAATGPSQSYNSLSQYQTYRPQGSIRLPGQVEIACAKRVRACSLTVFSSTRTTCPASLFKAITVMTLAHINFFSTRMCTTGGQGLENLAAGFHRRLVTQQTFNFTQQDRRNKPCDKT